MFYILSRIFACIASPIFYFIIILLWAVFTTNKIKKIVLVTVFAIGFIATTNNTLYMKAVLAWCDECLIDIDTTRHYDYAILPGGMTDIDTMRLRIEYCDAADRIIDCAWLMNKGIVDKMIITGDGSSNKDLHLPTFYDHMQTVYNISANRILIEPRAKNTIENFTKTIELFGDSLKNKKVLVINSAVFMRRTMLCCRKTKLECDFYTVDINTAQRPAWEMTLPNLELLEKWRRLIHEWIGYAAYIFY